MSILIKGMEMPKDCRECPFEMYYFHCGETRCRATLRTLATDFKTIPFDGRADDCPLIEIPPHGGLVDSNRLIEIGLHLMHTAKNDDIANGVKWLWQYLIEAPIVIEAEDGEK